MISRHCPVQLHRILYASTKRRVLKKIDVYHCVLQLWSFYNAL